MDSDKDYFLSEDYIDKFSEETLLLSRPPVRTGIPVVDIDRHKIGKVKRLHRHPDTNELESIEVSDGLMHSKDPIQIRNLGSRRKSHFKNDQRRIQEY